MNQHCALTLRRAVMLAAVLAAVLSTCHTQASGAAAQFAAKLTPKALSQAATDAGGQLLLSPGQTFSVAIGVFDHDATAKLDAGLTVRTGHPESDGNVPGERQPLVRYVSPWGSLCATSMLGLSHATCLRPHMWCRPTQHAIFRGPARVCVFSCQSLNSLLASPCPGLKATLDFTKVSSAITAFSVPSGERGPRWDQESV